MRLWPPELGAEFPNAMAELKSQERLQPSLLDRLIDDDPAKTHESDEKRTLTKQALRQAVLRDLSWLLNATGHGPPIEEKQFPHAYRSVLNFGNSNLQLTKKPFLYILTITLIFF